MLCGTDGLLAPTPINRFHVSCSWNDYLPQRIQAADHHTDDVEKRPHMFFASNAEAHMSHGRQELANSNPLGLRNRVQSCYLWIFYNTTGPFTVLASRAEFLLVGVYVAIFVRSRAGQDPPEIQKMRFV